MVMVVIRMPCINSFSLSIFAPILQEMDQEKINVERVVIFDSLKYIYCHTMNYDTLSKKVP